MFLYCLCVSVCVCEPRLHLFNEETLRLVPSARARAPPLSGCYGDALPRARGQPLYFHMYVRAMHTHTGAERA